jgi:F0F1-type ATP synthase assembly protein I
MSGNLVRVAGVVLGAVLGVTALMAINGPWGLVAGGAVFFGCAVASDRIWRRKATPEELRQELEDRARDIST